MLSVTSSITSSQSSNQKEPNNNNDNDNDDDNSCLIYEPEPEEEKQRQHQSTGKGSLLSRARNSTMNLASLASLATVSQRFHSSASAGNLWSWQHEQRRELAELSGESLTVKPLDYVPNAHFDEAPQPRMSQNNSNSSSNNNINTNNDGHYTTSAWTNPQNLALWIDNEIKSLVHDLEATSQLVRNKKHAKTNKRKWLSSSTGSRRNSSGAHST